MTKRGEELEARHRRDFLKIVMRVMSHQPHQQVEAWAMGQFDLIRAGRRGPRDVDDLAMSAWYRSCAPSWTAADVRRLAAIQLPGDRPEDDREPVTDWPPLMGRRRGGGDE